MDHVFIEQLEVHALIGIYDWERRIRQPLLFDIETDPDETTNLADRPDMAATVLRYAQKMLDWRLTSAERTLTNMHLGEGGVFARD